MLLPGQQAPRVRQLAETTKGRLEVLVAERIQPEKRNWVGGLRVFGFLEIAGDREAYLGDFGLRRGWLKQNSSEGLVKGTFPTSFQPE